MTLIRVVLAVLLLAPAASAEPVACLVTGSDVHTGRVCQTPEAPAGWTPECPAFWTGDRLPPFAVEVCVYHP